MYYSGVAVDLVAGDAVQLAHQVAAAGNLAGRALIVGLERLIHTRWLARKQERDDRIRLIVGQEEIGHLELFVRRLRLPAVPDARVANLVPGERGERMLDFLLGVTVSPPDQLGAVFRIE